MKWIENIIIGFLSLYLFGLFIEGFTFLKYIGLYGSILFFIINIMKKNYQYDIYNNNKFIINLYLAFLLANLISVLFSYYNVDFSLKEFRVEFLNVSIFALISLSIKNVKLLSKMLFWSILLAFIFNTLEYGYNYYSYSNLDFSIRLERNYSDYFEILYPFLLGGLFIIKNKTKYIIFIILLLGFFELLLTGARGAWISMIGETLLFFILIAMIRKEYLKKIIMGTMIGSILLIGTGYYLFKHSNLIKSKFAQGVKPNGRVTIIKTRFPIFIKHGNLLTGLGLGSEQYNKFFYDYNAPKVYVKYNKNYIDYISTEPIFINLLYKTGILGFLLYFIFSFVFIKYMFKLIKDNKYNIFDRIFIISIFSSYVGFYFIRGLVEIRSFKYMIIYLVLFLIIKENKNVENY